jgi:uncharacterized protein with NRDE domain
MCLILFAWQVHPDYPLVVAANRDEFYARPTAAAGFWTDAPAVLAGRDLEAGGTWLGLSRSGRFAALTNYRAPEHHIAGRPSRGRLVADFLADSCPALDYLERSAVYGRECNGYNLLVGDGERLGWASNVSGEIRELTPGIYGLSNHLLDTPWPKVGAGRTALASVIEALPDQSGLFQLLADDAIHPDHSLPCTGVSLEWERLLSAAFIRSADYGTRASTVVCIGRDGHASLEEQTWLPGAARGERRRFRFLLEPTPLR